MYFIQACGPTNLVNNERRAFCQLAAYHGIEEQFQVYLGFILSHLSLADGCIALQCWLGVEYGVVHILWVAILEAVFLADVAYRSIEQDLALVHDDDVVEQ